VAKELMDMIKSQPTQVKKKKKRSVLNQTRAGSKQELQASDSDDDQM
jgi:hypothetical protein